MIGECKKREEEEEGARNKETGRVGRGGGTEAGGNHGDTTNSCQESTVNCFTNTNFPACSCFGSEYVRVIRCIYGTVLMLLHIAIKTRA